MFVILKIPHKGHGTNFTFYFQYYAAAKSL